jgi:hypothetical protein
VGHRDQHCADYLADDEPDSNEPDYPTVEEPDLVVAERVDLA